MQGDSLATPVLFPSGPATASRCSFLSSSVPGPLPNDATSAQSSGGLAARRTGGRLNPSLPTILTNFSD